MSETNLGLCNQCRARVEAEFFVRDGALWIRKDCPTCGPNEARVSSDAAAWQAKRDLWQYVSIDAAECTMHCDRCEIDHKPNMVFVDVTNRCNMNCPICIATIRGMGFDFNPPLEYFDRLFAEVGSIQPSPVLLFFGGEPTVRNDLLDLLRLAKKHGLRPHVVTNGIRLADEEYCKKLCEARVRTRFAFDGRSPEIYEKLRHSRAAYDKKMKALDNLRKYSRRKQTIIATVGRGINDQYVGDLIQFCHENRDLISDLGIIPLTENWEPGTFEAGVQTTMEDVEKMVKESVPGGDVEFIPAGLSYAVRKARSFFRDNPRSEVLLFAGVHPNCESMTLLISDGTTFRSINECLRRPFTQIAVEFAAMAKAIEPKLDRLDPRKFLQRLRGQLLLLKTFGLWGLRRARLGRFLGQRIAALGRAICRVVFRKRSGGGPGGARRARPILRVAALPFEEEHSIDAGRLKNCKAVFAYEDVDDGKVKYIPSCLWYPYRNPILEKISKKYGVAGKPPPEQAAAPEIPEGQGRAPALSKQS